MVKRKEQEQEPATVELYLSKVQIGFNKFDRHYFVTNGVEHILCGYDPSNVSWNSSNLYNILRVVVESEGEEELELHCRGNQRQVIISSVLDGYWGRPKQLRIYNYFVRRLTTRERGFLEKQFKKEARKNKIKIKLVD